MAPQQRTTDASLFRGEMYSTSSVYGDGLRECPECSGSGKLGLFRRKGLGLIGRSCKYCNGSGKVQSSDYDAVARRNTVIGDEGDSSPTGRSSVFSGRSTPRHQGNGFAQ